VVSGIVVVVSDIVVVVSGIVFAFNFDFNILKVGTGPSKPYKVKPDRSGSSIKTIYGFWLPLWYLQTFLKSFIR
jgi:hypothetical protein